MRGEISAALRAEGPAGRKADGLFGTVFHIGEIRVLDGGELLLGLPRGVFAQVTGDVDEVVERVLGAVLGKSVRARFVDKMRLAEHRSAEAAPEAVRENAEGVHAPGSDPIEAAKSDPVVQDLIRRGGQVTDVESIE
jgi:hypothetical protein